MRKLRFLVKQAAFLCRNAYSLCGGGEDDVFEEYNLNIEEKKDSGGIGINLFLLAECPSQADVSGSSPASC